MLRVSNDLAVYLYLGGTDMRRSFDRLSAMVQEHFGRNSLDGAVYVFLSRDRKKVKLLHWERDGYWLHYKRLETSTFRVQVNPDGTEELTGVDLRALLSGMDLRRIKLSKKVQSSLSKVAAV